MGGPRYIKKETSRTKPPQQKKQKQKKKKHSRGRDGTSHGIEEAVGLSSHAGLCRNKEHEVAAGEEETERRRSRMTTL